MDDVMMRKEWMIFALAAFVAVFALMMGCTSPSTIGMAPATPTVTAGGVQAASGDWTMVNYDPTYSRNSPQTVIGKNNIGQLQVKWILNTGYAIENPPLIIGNTVYVQNNALQVIAIDLKTGLSRWKYNPHVATPPGCPGRPLPMAWSMTAAPFTPRPARTGPSSP